MGSQNIVSITYQTTSGQVKWSNNKHLWTGIVGEDINKYSVELLLPLLTQELYVWTRSSKLKHGCSSVAPRQPRPRYHIATVL